MSSQFDICTFLRSETLAGSLQQLLNSDRYIITNVESEETFLPLVENKRLLFDCLIVEDNPALLPIVKQLYKQGILFPVVIVKIQANNFLYHPASVEIELAKISNISEAINQALAQFVNLRPGGDTDSKSSNLLRLRQQQIAEKLPEPFCLLDGWHQRSPHQFFQRMSPAKKQIFLQQLKLDYRQILIDYFNADKNLKQKIDNFVNTAFSSNVPVPQIIEIHMELIEQFSKQLKLEGRSDEVLLDYRLTLIDIMAHLCEAYRCSISQ